MENVFQRAVTGWRRKEQEWYIIKMDKKFQKDI